ncbi:MAG: hypothetical protein JWP76_2580 [Dactylosporangium sp.]|nr:hypothetical protein [Dactylosporangium sp.]
MIFSRSRGSGGRHHKVDDARRARHAGRRPAHDEFGSDADEPSQSVASGPYDVTDAPDGVERLDLGSLQIPAIAGVEVRVQADPEGQVQQVVLVAGENALQLGVFAAPRTEGIWDEVREEIRQQLAGDGVTAEDVDGAYGIELRARIQTPEGVTDIRFVGVDGPRWMVRGVYQGPVATDPDKAGPLAACLEGLVVDRGGEAMPVREPLPLRLPREVGDEAGQTDDSGGVAVVADEAQSAPAEPADAHPQPKPSSRPRRRA